MLVKLLWFLTLLVMSRALACNEIQCPESSSCCVNRQCGNDEECNPFPVVVIPIICVFGVALIIGCLFAIFRRRKKHSGPAQPLIPRNASSTGSVQSRLLKKSVQGRKPSYERPKHLNAIILSKK